jgi:hypothetical protein
MVETEVAVVPRRELDGMETVWHAFAEKFCKLSGAEDVKEEEEEQEAVRVTEGWTEEADVDRAGKLSEAWSAESTC